MGLLGHLYTYGLSISFSPISTTTTSRTRWSGLPLLPCQDLTYQLQPGTYHPRQTQQVHTYHPRQTQLVHTYHPRQTLSLLGSVEELFPGIPVILSPSRQVMC